MQFHLSKRALFGSGLIFIIGALFGGGSWFWYDTVYGPNTHQITVKKVHYHANFRVFLEKDFVDFSGPGYMEELESCAVDPNKETPQDRVHLHDGKGDLVHIHDAWATWGHLLGNLRWNFGATYIADNTGKLYTAIGQNKVRFVLNGKLIQNPANLEIRSEDRLLIDYSNASNEDVLKRAATVPTSAHEQNSLPDPAACGGHDE